MSAAQTSAGMSGGEPLIPAGPHWFDAAMRLPGATLDNVSGGSRPDVDHDDQPDDGDLAALRAMNGPVVSANDGACVCGAEDGLFADPDPQCGVGSHRLAAQQSGADR